MSFNMLLEEMRKLPMEQRVELCEHALADDDTDKEDYGDPDDGPILSDEEFLAELQRGYEEILKDPSKGMTWEQIKQREGWNF
jgi:hypothetical protein